jgi:hypothetical protein
MSILNTFFSSTGYIATPIQTIFSNLKTALSSVAPTTTNDLLRYAGSLQNNLAEMCTLVLAEVEQAKIDAMNSFSPAKTNETMTLAQAEMLGLNQGLLYRTGAFVRFNGIAGLKIIKGTLVADSQYKYETIQDLTLDSYGAGVVWCEALVDGAWAIDIGTINQLATSLGNYTVTVFNDAAGIPSQGAEPIEVTRSRVHLVYNTPVIGSKNAIKSALMAVGVKENLISMPASPFRVIIGDFDLFDSKQLANTVYDSGLFFPALNGKQGLGTTQSIAIISPPNTHIINLVSANKMVIYATVLWGLTGGANTGNRSSIDNLIAQRLTDFFNNRYLGAILNQKEINNIVFNAIAEIIGDASVINLSDVILYQKINDVNQQLVFVNGFYDLDDETYLATDTSKITIAQA